MSQPTTAREIGAVGVVPPDHARVPTAEVARQYRYWRFRILATTIVGYALFYFVRTNIGVPLKAMGDDLGYSKEQLGIVLTIGGLTYGVSKFVNGFLGDHANPRYFMAIGLAACAAMNVLFGASSALLFLGAFWVMNNWGQGMGFPPCAKSMAYWFSPRERASTFGIWHTSHMIGAALISVLTGYLVKWWGWRSCFFIPAGLAALGAIIILIFLRDTPESLGLPPVEEFTGEPPPERKAEPRETYAAPAAPAAPVLEYGQAEMTYWQIVVKYVLLSPYMWVISFANFLVYILRYVPVHWGPTLLQEDKGLSQVATGWLGFGFEMAGMVGAIVAGFAADRIFGGRAGRVCVIAMALLVGATSLFWITPRGSVWAAGTLYVTMGFLIYVPQMLIAAMAMNLGTKRASAAAVGLTGIIGYASGIVTGWGAGRIADYYGWAGVLGLMLVCTLATLVLMATTWNVGGHREEIVPARAT